MAIDQNNPIDIFNQGLALRKAGEWTKAEALLTRATELSPDFTDAHIELAALIADRGRPDEATLILERVIEGNLNCSRARTALATVYIQLKRFDDAIRLVEDDAEDLAAQSVLGAACLKKGELDRARTIFERILLNDESAVDARMNLATIYARLGQPATAAKYMMSVLTG